MVINNQSLWPKCVPCGEQCDNNKHRDCEFPLVHFISPRNKTFELVPTDFLASPEQAAVQSCNHSGFTLVAQSGQPSNTEREQKAVLPGQTEPTACHNS